VVEERVFAAGGVAAAVRDAAEWRTHEQGTAVAGEPVIGHGALGDGPPRPRHAGAELPMDGVRVLDMTRVIAGPVCTRFVGALGADVLRVDPPGHPDMRRGDVADTLLGKRSAALDLADAASVAVLHQLLDEADVVVCGYRPDSLDRFGLGPDELAARHPGLVVVYLDAWGHTGPWAGRRGFDSVVQAATGIAANESQDGVTPGALPCQLLDHGTGYLAAAAVLDGWRRQSDGGGTHIRRLSLARTALWLLASAQSEQAVAGVAAGQRDATPSLVQFEDQTGAVEAVGPPGRLGDLALTWTGPPARYLADQPGWAER
jgi:crotonobetainyl-CoA:carnitine CoA-transferase CaiB-like acyl-CoA transferase